MVIEAPLSDHEAINIEEVLKPHAVCLPLKVYHESDYSNYKNGLIDGYFPHPMNTEMSIPPCSSTTISRKTVHEYGVGYSYSSAGSLEVNECMDGADSEVFANEFFTNGWFCSMDVNWQ